MKYEVSAKMLLLGIVVAAFSSQSIKLIPSYKDIKDRITQKQLQTWYAAINGEYFADRLPANVDIRWADLSSENAMGKTEARADHSFVITLDTTTNIAGRASVETLVHEMCHVATWGRDNGIDGHGKPFQTCMLNLAVNGALRDIW